MKTMLLGLLLFFSLAIAEEQFTVKLRIFNCHDYVACLVCDCSYDDIRAMNKALESFIANNNVVSIVTHAASDGYIVSAEVYYRTKQQN